MAGADAMIDHDDIDRRAQHCSRMAEWRRTGSGSHAGTSAWGARRGRAGEFAGYRPYEPGDDLRSLDLRIYRRLRERVVRVTREDASVPVTLLFDRSGSMFDPAPDRGRAATSPSRHLAILELATFFVALARRQRDSVRAFALHRRDGRSTAAPLPFSTTDGSAAIDRTLAMFPVDGELDLGQAIRTVPADPRGCGVAIVISDAFGLTDLPREIGALSRVGVPWWIAPLTRSELDPALSNGPVELVGREGTGRWSGVIDAATRARYREMLERRHAAIARELERWGGGLTVAATDRSLESFVDDVRRRGRWLR